MGQKCYRCNSVRCNFLCHLMGKQRKVIKRNREAEWLWMRNWELTMFESWLICMLTVNLLLSRTFYLFTHIVFQMLEKLHNFLHNLAETVPSSGVFNILRLARLYLPRVLILERVATGNGRTVSSFYAF